MRFGEAFTLILAASFLATSFSSSSIRRLDEALGIFLELIQRKPNNSSHWYNLACIYALQQKQPEALESLEKAIELDQKYKQQARTDSDFDSIRDSEAFQELVNEAE